VSAGHFDCPRLILNSPMARATTSVTVASEIADWAFMVSLARGSSGTTLVGPNAVALVKDM
jgi:hypothetical protein